MRGNPTGWCGSRLDDVGATDGLRTRFGEAEVLDLTVLDEVLHRSRDVFNGHPRIDPVLVEKVDFVDLETLQRGVQTLVTATQ